MIKVLIGDMFESQAQTLVNTVNCVGIMGKGIALEFKKRFPAMFKDYMDRCGRGEVRLGRPYLFKSTALPWILNFPTKDHWRSLAKIEDIVEGLEFLLDNYQEWGITSLAIPPLGAGMGQLEWRIIGPLLFRYLSRMDIPVELYAPFGTPTDELELSFLMGDGTTKQLGLRVPSPAWVKPAWVALVEIVQRVSEQPYHWPIGRITFQKMAYLAQVEGLPLELEFAKSSYGPFARNLKSMMSRLISNGLVREVRSGSMFKVLVGPTFEAARVNYAVDTQQWEPIIAKVSDLLMRASTKQAEVIATVVYTARELRQETKSAPSEEAVVKAALEWKQRRRPPLSTPEVATAVRNLAALDWLDVTPSPDLKVPEYADLEP
jgi:O-acetyl-ADP-ribose deacetylase (regulator of RNase III)/uncharacterized protein YwgA